MNSILGIWQSDPKDELTQLEFGNITIVFNENSELLYTIYGEDSMQKIFMTYEIMGNIILSDQPSSPLKIETKFIFLADGKLELTYDDSIARFIKIA